MPWTSSDAEKHTSLADTPKLQRLWATVANAVRERELRYGDESYADSQAIREANAVVKIRHNIPALYKRSKK